MTAAIAPNIILLTNTLYREPDLTGARFQLALKTAEAARDAGYRLMVVDSSPCPEVQKELEARGATVCRAYSTAMTMGEQKRYAFFVASQTLQREQVPLAERVIVCFEPEKVDIVAAVAAITAPILRGEADVVVPRRTEAGWASYPDFQVESEQRGIAAVADLTGRPDLDVFFGPVATNVVAAPLLINADPLAEGCVDKYEQLTLILRALAAGGRVVSVDVDFTYPSEQKAEEEGSLRDAMVKKRNDQLTENVAAFTTVWNNALAATYTPVEADSSLT